MRKLTLALMAGALAGIMVGMIIIGGKLDRIADALEQKEKKDA